LQDVRLINGKDQPPFENVSIWIEDEQIKSILIDNKTANWPKDAEVLKLSGKTVMPGLICAHGHLGLAQGTSVKSENYTAENIQRQIAQYEQYGITTIMSLGMHRDLLYDVRAQQEKGKFGGATILTADRGIGVPGGVPAIGLTDDPVYRPNTPEEARGVVREMAKRHPNMIKMWVDDNLHKLPPPKPEVYGAVIEEAHKLHLKVAAHVYYLADAQKLVNDHVDVLAHSVRDKPLDQATVQLIKARDVFYIPTLQLEDAFFIYADHPKWMNAPFFQKALNPDLATMLNSKTYVEKVEKDPATQIHRTALETAMKNLNELLEAKANIGFGTDSGANPYRIAGFAEHRELELMVEAGMTPLQAIHSATWMNAHLLGIYQKTGTVDVGKQADLIVLDDDPSENIRNTQKINMVFHNGKKVAGPLTK
jgi:imidazolonepropionase-like amidohydrolase